jgi:hypothetical protein
MEHVGHENTDQSDQAFSDDVEERDLLFTRVDIIDKPGSPHEEDEVFEVDIIGVVCHNF